MGRVQSELWIFRERREALSYLGGPLGNIAPSSSRVRRRSPDFKTHAPFRVAISGATAPVDGAGAFLSDVFIWVARCLLIGALNHRTTEAQGTEGYRKSNKDRLSRYSVYNYTIKFMSTTPLCSNRSHIGLWW